MIPRVGGRAVPVLLLLGCTPLGFWVYTDPIVTVTRVTLQLKEMPLAGQSPLLVALAVDNRNDYALATERIEVSLRLDGVPVGKLKRDSNVAVEMAAISTLAVALTLEKKVTPRQLVALNSGTHSFWVRGRATFRTPFGVRKVRFQQEGEMRFGERSTSLRP